MWRIRLALLFSLISVLSWTAPVIAGTTASWTVTARGAAYATPANLILTRIDQNTVEASWLDTGITPYFLLQVNSEDYITDPASQEAAYYGSATSANISWPYDNMEIYATLWGYDTDNVTHTTDYAEAMAGGTFLTQVAEALDGLSGTFDNFLIVAQLLAGSIFVLGMFGIALWYSNRGGVKAVVLFIISGLITLFIGITWIGDYEGISIAMMGLALFEFTEGAIMALSSGGPSKGVSQLKGWIGNMRKWF